MNSRILNSDYKHPDDGWYRIEPKGNHPNRAANVLQVVDEEAKNSIVNRFNSEAEAGTLRHGSEMLINYDHLKDDQETRAAGWVQELQNRADGIYARIRWSKSGQGDVDGGDYRFFSTEYLPKDLQRVSGGEGNLVRPLRLDGLALTNMPNNLGQTPITNRANAPAPRSAAKENPEQAQAEKARLWTIAYAAGKQFSVQPSIGHKGADIFSGVVALVRNRTGSDHHTAFNDVQRDNSDLFNHKDSLLGVRNFDRLLNRSEKATGRSGIWTIQKAASEIQALANRCAPFMAAEPIASQWEVLYRAASVIAKQPKVQARIVNRAPGEVDAADWKNANSSAEGVLKLLENEPGAVDRGQLIAKAPASVVRGVFRRSIQRLMSEQGLDQRAAFEKLRDNEPLFWTLAVLVIDDIGLNGADPNYTELTRGGIRVFSQAKRDEIENQQF